MPDISEELVSVVRERVALVTGSAIVADCLMALAHRGVYTHRELPGVAKNLAARFPDMTEIVADTVDAFAFAAGLPHNEFEHERIPGGGLTE